MDDRADPARARVHARWPANRPTHGRVRPGRCPTVCRVPRTSALRGALAEVGPVGGGLFVLGVSAYVVLGLAGHTLPPGEYAAVASLYLLAAITGPGVFTAVEQETNREVSSRRAAGLGDAAGAAGPGWCGSAGSPR